MAVNPGNIRSYPSSLRGMLVSAAVTLKSVLHSWRSWDYFAIKRITASPVIVTIKPAEPDGSTV